MIDINNSPDMLQNPQMSDTTIPTTNPIPTPINKDVVQEQSPEEMSYIINANFTEDEESDLMKLMTNEMARIRLELDDADWLEKCEKADDEYDGTHIDDEDTDLIDIKLLLTTITIDIIASRAYRQTWTPNPCVMMEAEFVDDQLMDILHVREENIDYYLRNKAKLQDVSLPLYRAAGKYGTAILKTYYKHHEELRTKRKFYRPGNQDDIKKFEEKYKKKLRNPQSKEFGEWLQLKQWQGKPIAKKESDNVTLYHGAKVYRVDPKNFYARPKIKDFNRHILISELFKYNWYDIESNAISGFWDKDKVEDLRSYAGAGYEQKDFDFYESIVWFDRAGEDGKLKHERYLVTHESMTKKIVRAIYYPYDECCYVPYTIFENDDSWIGYSITERMKDIVTTANSVINSFVGEQDLAHTPIIISNSKKVGDWTIVLGQPNLLPVDPGNMQGTTTFSQYRMETPSTDRIAFLQWILSYISILTGVDPMLLSGAQDPTDKRAPAAKTQMKLQASTIRIEDMIVTLQKGDAEVAKQIESIIYKFPEDINKNYGFVSKGQNQEIDPQFFERPVRYVMAGSRMAFDRNMDLAVIMQTIDFLTKFFPEIMQDMTVKKSFLTAVLNNSQGTVEKMKDDVMKPMLMIVQSQQQEQQKLQQVLEQVKAQGGDPQEFMKFLMQRGKQGQSPQPPANQMPPRPPQMPLKPPIGRANG